jgi:hypothetical protein
MQNFYLEKLFVFYLKSAEYFPFVTISVADPDPWASWIQIHKSEVQLRIRICNAGYNPTAIVNANKNMSLSMIERF